MISYIICCFYTHCFKDFLSTRGKTILKTACDEILLIFNSFMGRCVFKCRLNLRGAGAVSSPIGVCLPLVEDISVLSRAAEANVFGDSACLYNAVMPEHPCTWWLRHQTVPPGTKMFSWRQKDAQGSSVSCGTFLRIISSAKSCQAAVSGSVCAL